MKTIIITLITLVALNVTSAAQETSVKIKPSGELPDSVTSKKPYQAKEIIRIGTKEIWSVETDPENSKNKDCDSKKNRIPKFQGHWEAFQIGFNNFANTDYSMYNGIEFMRLDQGKSMEIDLNFGQTNISIYKSYIGMVSGLGVSFNSYRFEEPYTIKKGTSGTEAVLLETENLSKTKLAVSYLQAPLLLEFQIPVNDNERRLFISAGVIGGVRIGSHTKVKQGDLKGKNHSSFNINPFKYAVTARIGYGKTGLFATYNLNRFFESGKGPALTPFTIGIVHMASSQNKSK